MLTFLCTVTPLVPPVMHLEDNHPTLGNEEVSLVTCTAAGSKPPAEVKWLTGALADKMRATTSSTEHANGTTTTVSTLLGVPTREINQHLVRCVITSAALSKEETLPFTTQVYCGYTNTSLLSVTYVVCHFVHCLFIHGYAMLGITLTGLHSLIRMTKVFVLPDQVLQV